MIEEFPETPPTRHVFSTVPSGSYLMWFRTLYKRLGMKPNYIKNIIRTVLYEPSETRILFAEMLEVLGGQIRERLQQLMDGLLESFEYYTGSAAVGSQGEQVLTRGMRRKGKRHRFRPASIFSALSHSCFQFGRVAAIAGPDKQAALHLFGLLFNMAAQITSRRRREEFESDFARATPDREEIEVVEEKAVGGMSQSELIGNVAMLVKSVTTLLQAQQQQSLSRIEISQQSQQTEDANQTKGCFVAPIEYQIDEPKNVTIDHTLLAHIVNQTRTQLDEIVNDVICVAVHI
jgi:hypothetical protein